MRVSGIDSSMSDLERLLASLHAGRLALPDFQRDFDWADSDVEQLLVTVFSGWPAGSLLMMRAGNQIFHLRGFEGATKELDKVDLIVLDGQQRLTSLYQALYNRGPNVYAVSFHDLVSGAELEDAIRSIPRHEWDTRYGEVRTQVLHGLVPCYQLRTPTDFFDWRDAAIAAVGIDEQEGLKEQLTSTYSEVLSTIHRYQFPTVTLEESVEPAAIARIFERVNRLGMPLSTFDLMVATLYEPDWNLRTKWEEVRRDKPMVDSYLQDDGMPLLQTIALRFKDDIRQSAVLRLHKRTVYQDWDRAASGLEDALSFLRKNCGVEGADLIPYRSMIILFAAVATEQDLYKHRALLQQFFWSKSFAQAYDVAANTKVVSDYEALLDHLKELQALPLPAIDPTELYFAARRSHKAIWAAFVCALAVADPDGLFVGLVGEEEPRQGRRTKREVSVLPRGLEPDIRDAAPPHLRVLSLVRTSRSIAPALGRTDIRTVLGNLLENHDREVIDRALGRQFLPNSQEVFEIGGDWPELLRQRGTKFGEYLEEVYDVPFVPLDEVSP